MSYPTSWNGDPEPDDEPQSILVPCEACGSEGRIYRGHPNDPHPRDCGPCPECGGTGEIEGELIIMEDLEWK